MDIERDGVLTRFAVEDLSDEEFASLSGEVKSDKRSLDVSLALGNVSIKGVDLAGLAPDSSRLKTEATIESQVDGGSYRAYATVVDQLNRGKKSSERVDVLNQERLTSELSKWMTDEKLQYVEQSVEKDPDLQFTLVITPNVKVTTDRIIQLAKTFGEGQPYPTYPTVVYECLLEEYKPDELSGYDPNLDSPVRFKLYPSKVSPDFQGTVAKQKSKLVSAQAEHPFLCVSSILDDVCHWQTLCEDGIKTGSVFNRTYIRHFNLEPRYCNGWHSVPESFIYANGGPHLNDSFAVVTKDARVLVG